MKFNNIENDIIELPLNSTRPSRFDFGFGSRNSMIRTLNDMISAVNYRLVFRKFLFGLNMKAQWIDYHTSNFTRSLLKQLSSVLWLNVFLTIYC